MTKKLFLSIFLVFMAFSCVLGAGIILSGCNGKTQNPNQDINSNVTYSHKFYTDSTMTTLYTKVYSYGGSYTLPAALTKEGYRFNAWTNYTYGDISAMASTSLSGSQANRNDSWYANWTDISATATFNPNGGTWGDSSTGNYSTKVLDKNSGDMFLMPSENSSNALVSKSGEHLKAWTTDTAYVGMDDEFECTGSSYYAIDRKYGFEGSNYLTVSVWAYMDDWTQLGSGHIISWWNHYGWEIGGLAGSSVIQMVVTNGGGDGGWMEWYIPVSDLAPGWHMFTMTTNCTSSYATTYFMLDGCDLGESSSSIGGGISGESTGSASVIIGAECDIGDVPAGDYFKGKIKNVYISNQFLQDQEANFLFAQGCQDTPVYSSGSTYVGSDVPFDSSGGNYYTIDKKYGGNQSTAFTASIWGYMDDWTSISSTSMLMSWTNSGGWGIYANASTGYVSLDINVQTSYLEYENGDYTVLNFAKLSDLSPGWHMFTFTFDAVYIVAYVDGLSTSSISFNNQDDYLLQSWYNINYDKDIIVGGECGYGSSICDGLYFPGKLKSPYILNGVSLRRGQVYSLYSGKPPIYITDDSFMGVEDKFCPYNDDYMRLDGRKYGFSGSSNLTVSCWAYLDNWSGATNQDLISFTNDGGWALASDSSNLIFDIRTNSHWYSTTIIASLSSLSSGWHMFSAVFNGSTVVTYLDGVQQNTSSLGSGQYIIADFNINNNKNIIIGNECGYNSGISADGSYFPGRIKNVFIAGYSSADISAMYDQQKVKYEKFVKANSNKTFTAVWERNSVVEFDTNEMLDWNGKWLVNESSSGATSNANISTTYSDGVQTSVVKVNSNDYCALILDNYSGPTLEVGKKYSWSVELKSTASHQVMIGCSNGRKTVEINSSWQKYDMEYIETTGLGYVLFFFKTDGVKSSVASTDYYWQLNETIYIRNLTFQLADEVIADSAVPSRVMPQKGSVTSGENLYDLSNLYLKNTTCDNNGVFTVDYTNSTTSEKYADFRPYNTGKIKSGKSYTYVLEVLTFECSAESQDYWCGETFNWQEINTNETSCFSNVQIFTITGTGTYKGTLTGRGSNYRWLSRDFIPIQAGVSLKMTFKIAIYENSDTYLGENLYNSNPNNLELFAASVNKGVYSVRFTSNSSNLYTNLFNSNNIDSDIIKAGKSYTFVVDVLKFSCSYRNGVSFHLGSTSGRTCRFDGEAWFSILGAGRYTATLLGVDYQEGITEYFSRSFIAYNDTAAVTLDMVFTISLYETEGYFPEVERKGFTHLGWTKEKGDGQTLNALSSVKSEDDHMLYSAWEADPVTITFDFKFETDITKNDYADMAEDMSDFSYVVEYRDLNYNYTLNDTEWVTNTVPGSQIVVEMRQWQNIVLSNIEKPDGWGCVGVCLDSTQIAGFGLDEWAGGEVAIEDNSVTVYLCFKKLSDNRLRYDSVDEYFYFEDGVFPQTAVVTLENGLALEQTLASQTATTSEIDGLGTAKFVTLNGFRYMGVQVVEDDGDSTTTASKTVKLRDNDSSSETYLEYKDYTFSEGIYYWFRFDPIRWRVSDYGVSEDEIPTDWANYAQGQTNVEVISDVLWFDALNDKENDLGVYDPAYQTTLMKNLTNGTFLAGQDLEILYAVENPIIDIDAWAPPTSNDKVYNYEFDPTSDTSVGQMTTRIASLSEIGGYQRDLRSYASQLVCVLSGKAQNQYFEYWTRDFGQQIGAGTYVTRSGVVMKNSYYTARKGVRFAYNMMESSNTGDFTDGTIDLTLNSVAGIEGAATKRTRITPRDNEGNYWRDLFQPGGVIHLEFSTNLIDIFRGCTVHDAQAFVTIEDNKIILDYKITSSTGYLGMYSFVDFWFSGSTEDEDWQNRICIIDKFTYTPPN